MNIALITGNLTNDVALERKTNADGSVAYTIGRFTIATNDGYDAATKERKTMFIPCVIFNAAAENLARLASKGTRVAVDGKVNCHSAKNADGSFSNYFNVQVEQFEVMSRSNSAEATNTAVNQTVAAPAPVAPQAPAAPQAPVTPAAPIVNNPNPLW